MRVAAALWTWVQAYGAQVLRGEQSGGQRDIRLGKRIRLELGPFFNGTKHKAARRRYAFTVEPYTGIPEWPLTIVVNPANDQRANEVRLVRQDPRSSEAYPLWIDVIARVPNNQRAVQSILFLKDLKGRIHLRCVGGRRMLSLLPKELRDRMAESLQASGAPSGVWIPRDSRSIRAALGSGPPRTTRGRVPPWVSNPPNWEELRRRGILGEKYVLADLRAKYPEPRYLVEHVAEVDPFSDHDIRVLLRKSRRVLLYVEVKATVGRVGSPVRISGREVAFLRRYRKRHNVFVVYLRSGGRLPPEGVIRVDSSRMVLVASEYFLWPRT